MQFTAFNFMMFNVLGRSYVLDRLRPDVASHVLVAFDLGRTTFRAEMYADCKGGRAKTQDEFH